MEEFLCFSAAVIAVVVTIGVVGHGIWLLMVAALRAIGLPGTPPQARRQGHCRSCAEPLNAGTDRCPRCGLQILAIKTTLESDLEATDRQLRRMRESDVITEEEWLTWVTRLVEQRKGLVGGRSVTAPGRRASSPSQPAVEERPVADTDPVPLIPVDEEQPAVASAPSRPIDSANTDDSVPAATAPIGERTKDPVVPSAPLTSPAASVASTDARWTKLVQTFMQDRNIRWGELISGLLIVMCSLGLVISLWSELKQTIYFPALLFMFVTASIHGAGWYTLRRWKLRSTSRGLLHIALLLVPLNVAATVALADVEQGGQRLAVTHPGYIAIVAIGAAVFGAVTVSASRLLYRIHWWPPVVGVVGTSAIQLILSRLVGTEDDKTRLLVLSGFVLVPLLVPITAVLATILRSRRLKPWRVQRCTSVLGVSLFGWLVAMGLLLTRLDDWQFGLAAVAPALSFVLVLLVGFGQSLSVRLANSPYGGWQTAGLAIALASAVMGVGLCALIWQQPDWLVVVALTDAVALFAIACLTASPLLLPPAIFASTIALLTTVFVTQGLVTWNTVLSGDRLIELFLMGRSGLILAGVTLGTGCAAIAMRMWSYRSAFAQGANKSLLWTTCGLALLAVITAGYAGFAPNGQDRTAATAILSAISVASLVGAVRRDRSEFAWVGAILLFLAIGHAFVWNEETRAALLQRAWLPREPLIFSLLTTTSVTFGMAWLFRKSGRASRALADATWLTFLPAGLSIVSIASGQNGVAAAYSGWIAGLGFLVGWIWVSPAVWGTAQVASVFCLTMVILWQCGERTTWGRLEDPRVLSIVLGALGAWCCGWPVLGRLMRDRHRPLNVRKRIRRLLPSHEFRVDHVVGMTALSVTVAMVVAAVLLQLQSGLVGRPPAGLHWLGVMTAVALISAAFVSASLTPGSPILAVLMIVAFACFTISHASWRIPGNWFIPRVALASLWSWLPLVGTVAAGMCFRMERRSKGIDVAIAVAVCLIPLRLVVHADPSVLRVPPTALLVWLLVATTIAATIRPLVLRREAGAAGPFSQTVIALCSILIVGTVTWRVFAVEEATLVRDAWMTNAALAGVAGVWVFTALGMKRSTGLLAGALLIMGFAATALCGLAEHVRWVRPVHVWPHLGSVAALLSLLWLWWARSSSGQDVSRRDVRWREGRPLQIQLTLTSLLSVAPLLIAVSFVVVTPGRLPVFVEELGRGPLQLSALLTTAVYFAWRRTNNAAISVYDLVGAGLLVIGGFALSTAAWNTADTWATYHALLGAALFVVATLSITEWQVSLRFGDSLRAAMDQAAYVISLIAMALAVRGLGVDPVGPSWSVAAFTAVGLTVGFVAATRRLPLIAYLSTVLIAVAAAVSQLRPWLWESGGGMDELFGLVAVVLSATSLCGIWWLSWQMGIAERAGLSGASFTRVHQSAAAIGVVAFVGLSVGTLIGRSIAPEIGLPQLDQTTGIVGVALLAGLCVTALGDSAATYALPLAMLLPAILGAAVLDRYALTPRVVTLWLQGCLATYAVAIVALVTLGDRMARVCGGWKVAPAHFDRARITKWASPALLVGLGLIAVIACEASAKANTTWHRFFATSSMIVGAAAATVFAHRRDSDEWKRVALAAITVTFVAFGWALMEDGALQQPTLQIVIRLMESLGLLAFGLTMMSSNRRPLMSRWTTVGRQFATVLAGGTLALLIVILGMEVRYLYLPEGVPITNAQMLVVASALTALIVSLIVLAVDRTNVGWGGTRAQRQAYVYASEVVAGLLVAHVYLVRPDWFGGVFLAYWPFVVLALAYAGVGAGEYLERKGLDVLAEPLRHTGVFLPLVPVIGFLVQTRVQGLALHGTLSGLLMTTGLLYLFVSLSRRSMVMGLITALVANLSLWSFWWERGTVLIAQPQIWLIPPALTSLVAAQWNRARLTQAQLTSIRYACVSLIYLTSTADLFLKGIGDNLWPPMLLATFSLIGVLAGIGLQVRAFLYTGSTFLLLSVLSMIWHAQQRIGHTWPWWAFGIVMGLAVLALFGVMEKRRNEMRRVINNLRGWDA